MRTTAGLVEGATVKLTGSFSWPNLVTKIERLQRDSYGLITGVLVDVGRDDGPALFRPSDIEIVPATPHPLPREEKT